MEIEHLMEVYRGSGLQWDWFMILYYEGLNCLRLHSSASTFLIISTSCETASRPLNENLVGPRGQSGGSGLFHVVPPDR